jgi:hypothetical protein
MLLPVLLFPGGKVLLSAMPRDSHPTRGGGAGPCVMTLYALPRPISCAITYSAKPHEIQVFPVTTFPALLRGKMEEAGFLALSNRPKIDPFSTQPWAGRLWDGTVLRTLIAKCLTLHAFE